VAFVHFFKESVSDFMDFSNLRGYQNVIVLSRIVTEIFSNYVGCSLPIDFDMLSFYDFEEIDRLKINWVFN
jgi:hypothetical protein